MRGTIKAETLDAIRERMERAGYQGWLRLMFAAIESRDAEIARLRAEVAGLSEPAPCAECGAHFLDHLCEACRQPQSEIRHAHQDLGHGHWFALVSFAGDKCRLCGKTP